MRTHLALVIVSLVGIGVGCTAFVASELSGTQGTVVNKLGGCFNLADNACGQCIATQCENPNGSPPVSLAQVCKLDQYSSIVTAAGECSNAPSLESYNCQDMYVDGGTYAASIDTESAAVNNLQQCITTSCAASCSPCAVQVPTCGNDSVTLVEAGTCGTCIDQYMNTAGSDCQPYVKGACSEYPSSSIAQCAIPSGSCSTADCTDIQSPSTNLSDAGYALYSCLWQHCSSSCPSP